MSSTGAKTNMEPSRGCARPTGHEGDERHEVLGDPHVGVTVAGLAQRGGAHAVRRGLRLVRRAAVRARAEVRVLGQLGRLADATSGAARRRAPNRPCPRHPGASCTGRATRTRRMSRRLRQRKLGERRRARCRRATPTRVPPASRTGKWSTATLAANRSRPHELGRRLGHAARHVDLPPVVDAAGRSCPRCGRAPATRGGAGRARRGNRSGRPRPERDVVLAEEAHRHRRRPVDEVRREGERDPVVLPHEPTHRRVAFDAGQQLVLRSGDHGASSARR